jgi:hypothetical protein
MSRIYKELKNKHQKHPINKWPCELNRQFSKEEAQMAKKYMMKCLTTLAIKEIQMKTKISSHSRQNSLHQENKQQMLVRMLGEGTLITLLVGM